MSSVMRSEQIRPPKGERRRFIRRSEDQPQDPDEQNRKLQSLLELGQLISSDLQVEYLLYQIAQKATALMKADRGSIFLHDPARDELWTTVALGIEGRIIRLSAKEGIAGFVFQSAATLNLRDAYEDPRFNKQIDLDTGYRTRSILCLPIFTRDRHILGVIQLLNAIEGIFTDEDEVFLRTFANHAAVFLEMAQLQKARLEALEQSRQELKRLNQVKDKALDHLSHELRTPLSVIQGSLRILKRKCQKQESQLIEESFFNTLEKHLRRLLEIQQETDKIIRSNQFLEETFILKEAKQLWERLNRSFQITGEIHNHWQLVAQWMEEQIHGKETTREEMSLVPFIQEILERNRDQRSHRSVTIEVVEPLDLTISMDPLILKEILISLIKNAIENTPDEGTIRIRWEKGDSQLVIRIEDFGIGITEENQKSLFDGLFHTQETDLYTSKKPYDFYAGGKGLGLLQAKLYGQRFGFDLSVESRRCMHIPDNGDLCPGKISDCPYCQGVEDCLISGGSIFCLSFPIKP